MRRLPLLFALAVAAAVPGVANAGMSILKTHRSVSAGIASDETAQPTTFDSDATDAAGLFAGSATVRVSNDLGDHSDGSSTQRSVVRPGLVTATGEVFPSSSGDAVSYASTIDVRFRLDESEAYRLDMHFAYDQFQGPGQVNPFLAVRLRDVTTGADVVAESYNNDFIVRPITASSAGSLAAGVYELTFDLHDVVGFFANDGKYNLSFSTGSDGGGGTPNAVPLPPAAYAGLLTLGGIGASQWRSARRRRQRRAVAD